MAASTPSDDAWLQGVVRKDVVVFDGYGFTGDHHRSARACAATVAAIDDTGGGRYDVDVVVNPNPASPSGYTVEGGTRLLIGPRYALLRREFRIPRPPRSDGGGLLLTFGGTDPAGLGRRVTDLLASWCPFERVRLVIGPGASINDVSPHQWLETVCDPPAPAAVFHGADAAISAAGSTTWELLALGVPVALVRVADNQRVVVEGAVAAGAALDAGTAESLEETLPSALERLARPAVRHALSAAGHQLVDGHGAERVFSALVE